MSQITCRWAEDAGSHPLPIYFGSEYQTLFSDLDGTQARVLEANGPDQCIWLALLTRDLGPGISEAYTAYGYGGVWPPTRVPLTPEFVAEIKAFLASEGVLCALIRHSPFLTNHESLPATESEFNRLCYIRDLEGGQTLEHFCSQIDQKVRWSINYAKRSGLTANFFMGNEWPVSEVSEFYKIYSQLMQAKDTNNYYLFSETFFLNHGRNLGNNCELATIRAKTGQMVAAAFFMLDENGWAHYHLSASDKDFAKFRPMELLLAEAAVRYGNRGYKALHFGGGLSLDASDGLSRFKRKFSTRTSPFHISKWILDPVSYAEQRNREPLRHPQFLLISEARG